MAQFNLKKEKSRSSLYDENWKVYRIRFLKVNPNCYACNAKASVVDHWRAHKGNIDLFKELTNHIPLCVNCHNYVTGKFDRHKDPFLIEKLKWLKEKRELSGTTVKVRPLSYYGKRK